MSPLDLFICVMGFFSAFVLPFIDLVQAARDKVRATECGADLRLTPGEMFTAIIPDLLVGGIAIIFILLGSNPAGGMYALFFAFCFGLGTAAGVLYSRRRSL